MAGVAGLVGLHVAGRFTGSGSAIMAAGAAAHHRTVIYPGDRCPGNAAMAKFTACCRLNMSARLASGSSAVVTAVARTGDRGMINSRTCPGSRGMAGLAWLVGLDMRRCFTGSDRTVVAAGAAARYLAMIDTADGLPANSGVAGFTAGS